MSEVEKVIAAGMCVGCGTCAFARPDTYTMKMTAAGHFEAQAIAMDSDARLSRLCPMSGVGNNETEIATLLYPELPVDENIGRHLDTFAAHVAEGGFRARGGSGGLLSWVLAELFRRGDIDAAVHVKPAEGQSNDGLLFHYAISETEQDFADGAKSRYYPIEMSSVLTMLRTSTKRYAVVGLPCFIKAVRLMQLEGLLPAERTPFCLGLVCGHLKSRHFAEYLARQKGAAPDTLASFDFRRKLLDRRASDYGFAYQQGQAGPETPEEVWPMASVRGRDWGEGLFKNPACEFCDDVLAECADIAVGDAWLPDYVNDPLGTNIVVTRHPYLDRIIKEGAARGAVVVRAADVASVIRSQSSGLRHRREGLAHRLARRRLSGQWTPMKRVEPRLAATAHRRAIYDARLEIAQSSAENYGLVRLGSQGLEQFEHQMAPAVRRYRKASDREAGGRLRKLVKRVLQRLRSALRR